MQELEAETQSKVGDDHSAATKSDPSSNRPTARRERDAWYVAIDHIGFVSTPDAVAGSVFNSSANRLGSNAKKTSINMTAGENASHDRLRHIWVAPTRISKCAENTTKTLMRNPQSPTIANDHPIDFDAFTKSAASTYVANHASYSNVGISSRTRSPAGKAVADDWIFSVFSVWCDGS